MLSRFWYFVLAGLCGGLIAAFMILHAGFARRMSGQADDALGRDRVELELWISKDARQRMDSIVPMAAHPEVRSSLAAASRRSDRSRVDAGLRRTLNDALAKLNKALRNADASRGGAADLLFALDAEGEIISQLGGSTPPPGAGLGRFPVVRRALVGYAGDDVWFYNGDVYRIATHPVVQEGAYVGAIVHGMRFDAELAQQLANVLPGAGVAFFARGRVIATYLPSVGRMPSADNLGVGLQQAGSQLDDAAATKPIDIGLASRAIYRPIIGSAAHAGVGYALVRPVETVPSALGVLTEAEEGDVASVSWLWVIVLPVVLFGLGLAFFWLEHDSPFRKLARETAELGRGERQHVVSTEYRGRFRQLVASLNDAVELAVRAETEAQARRPKDVDSVLGGHEERVSRPHFGFGPASDPPRSASTASAPAVEVPPSPKVPSAPSLPPATPKVPSTSPPSPPSGAPISKAPATPASVSPSASAATSVGASAPRDEAPAPSASSAPAASNEARPSEVAKGLADTAASSLFSGLDRMSDPMPLVGAEEPLSQSKPLFGKETSESESLFGDESSESDSLFGKGSRESKPLFGGSSSRFEGREDPTVSRPLSEAAARIASSIPPAGETSPRSKPPSDHDELLGVVDVRSETGSILPPLPASLARGPVSAAFALGAEDEDEGATMLAPAPSDLLEEVQRSIAENASSEESHYRDVYKQFIAMKEACAEPTEGLTFDRFRGTLERNRNQIRERYGVAEVTFTVYEKDGRAAIKATPRKG